MRFALTLSLAMFLSGCVHNQFLGENKVRIEDVRLKNDSSIDEKYVERISRFDYLLSASVKDMLEDLNLRTKKPYRNLVLTISYSDDNEQHLRSSKGLNKHFTSTNINYTLENEGKILFNNQIKCMESFNMSNNSYSDLLSLEDSEVQSIAKITKHIELSIIEYFKRK